MILKNIELNKNSVSLRVKGNMENKEDFQILFWEQKLILEREQTSLSIFKFFQLIAFLNSSENGYSFDLQDIRLLKSWLHFSNLIIGYQSHILTFWIETVAKVFLFDCFRNLTLKKASKWKNLIFDYV